MFPIRWLQLALVAALAVLLATPALAQPPDTSGAAVPAASAGASEDCDETPESCPIFSAEELATGELRGEVDGTLEFFWGVGCPHCEKAKPFVDRLERDHPQLTVRRWEVRKNRDGRRHFLEVVRRLGITAPGIPTFTYGDRYVVGYSGEATERRVLQMLRGEQAVSADGSDAASSETVARVDLPLIGAVNPSSMSLPTFTLVVGLIDGINPCAMWVLMVLLGILMHVRSRKRLFLFGGLFVFVSGLVYFLFMTVWVGLFELVGLSRTVTIVLGLAVLAMGLVNLKELVWFKRGPSLTIPDEAKPKLYKRMRGIANAASLPAAVLGITTLAFFVNVIELGCTLGLPAVYTRVLTLHPGLSGAGRMAYLAMYNVAYVVPLALIVALFGITLHRLTLSQRGAKVLKGVSGTLLVAFGLLFILAPGLLS